MDVINATAPSHWASYLINGDSSGIDQSNVDATDQWIERQGMGLPVSCEDAGFMWTHDACVECPLGSDCQTYVFLVRGNGS